MQLRKCLCNHWPFSRELSNVVYNVLCHCLCTGSLALVPRLSSAQRPSCTSGSVSCTPGGLRSELRSFMSQGPLEHGTRRDWWILLSKVSFEDGQTLQSTNSPPLTHPLCLSLYCIRLWCAHHHLRWHKDLPRPADWT